jgi:inorganic triphosphatase YgiF
MTDRPDLPGWLWPLAAIVIVCLSCEILFETVYQSRNRELEHLAQQTADLQTKLLEAQTAWNSLDQFHEEVRQLDSELAKLHHILPQTADLAADAELRWLREAFATAGFTARKNYVGDLDDRELVIARRTPFIFSTPTPRERLKELMSALSLRLPAHSLIALGETRQPGTDSSYQFVLEVSALKPAPAGGR